MEFEKELERQIGKLKRSIRKLVLGSKEFTTLRELLTRGEFELQIYLIPSVKHQGATGAGAPSAAASGEIRFELTKEDRAFLKRAGIRFEDTIE